jgi:hypothetical protein
MAQFEPLVEVIQPRAGSKPEHLGTVRIDVGDRRVHVLLYDNGRIRFRINHTPTVIDECYLQGGQNHFTILGIRPGE